MLLLLTGNVRIGKTRWLQKAIGRLEEGGVACHGVVAPGTWVKTEQGLEKTGIDNLLLPSHELVPFARRADLAKQDGVFDPHSQAARAQLRWHISDDAVARVNAHFVRLRRVNEQAARERQACLQDKGGASHVEYDPLAPDGSQGRKGSRPRLDPLAENGIRMESPCADGPAAARQDIEPRAALFVDELGQLELLHGEGLTEAMALLAQGPQGLYRHAVVVVRDAFGLPERVADLFAEAWGGSCTISPTNEAWQRWLAPLMHSREVDGAQARGDRAILGGV